MARVEIIDPGRGTYDSPPDIRVNGVRIPGVIGWRMSGGGPVVEVELECYVTPTPQTIENGEVRYILGPMPLEMKRQLYAALMQEFEGKSV